MIVDTLDHAELYASLHPGFRKAFDFLKKSQNQLPDNGTYELDGRDVYASVSGYETRPLDTLKWEAHRQYTDIQYIAEGEECIGYANIADLVNADAYQADKDCCLAPAAEHVTYVNLKKGMFVILFPQDAHMPCGRVGQAAQVRKIVAKVRI